MEKIKLIWGIDEVITFFMDDPRCLNCDHPQCVIVDKKEGELSRFYLREIDQAQFGDNSKETMDLARKNDPDRYLEIREFSKTREGAVKIMKKYNLEPAGRQNL